MIRTLSTYLELTKPRLLPLVLFSGLPALGLAAGGWPSGSVIVATLLGTSLAAGAANVLNSYFERERDAQMERTQDRPLPAGRIRPEAALVFGLSAAVLGTGMLWVVVGGMAAAIALAAILSYVFVYTLWLKPRTPFAVVVGGFSGAIAPLIADAAVDGRLSILGGLLFAVIFLWQPPHFYAIALYRRQDYMRAGFPMLFDRVGEAATHRRILLWIVATIAAALMIPVFSSLGWLYMAVAVGLSAWFLFDGVRLARDRSRAAARRLFWTSLFFLMGVFLAMLADLGWAAWG